MLNGCPAIMSKRPNIILIMADNQPADMLGCYGNSEIHTPYLDTLAAQGMRFANAFCVNAMCSPCRASVLTGLMPSAHGVHSWLDDGLADSWPQDWNAIGEFPTLSQQLKSAGYDTALIGKYHLGQPWHAPKGFDHWVTFPHGHTVSFHGNLMIENDCQQTFDGHSVDYFADRTVDYIQQRQQEDAPFFCFVPFNGPYGHWPAIRGRAGTAFDHLYDKTGFATIPREGLNRQVIDRYTRRVVEAGAAPHERFAGPLLLPNETESLRNYFAQTTLIDDAVGRIMTQLTASGLEKDTIVVYTADHGFSLGHHGIWGHGLAAWPSSMHRPSYQIPLIISGPGVVAGTNRGLVSQLDLPNTLLAAAGVEPLAGPRQDSQVIELGKPDSSHRNFLCLEQEETRAIRTPTHLYVERFQHPGVEPLLPEFYDLTTDPNERANLVADTEEDATLPVVAADMAAAMHGYFDRHADPVHDLWTGGRAKSNITDPGFWKAAWGEKWDCLI